MTPFWKRLSLAAIAGAILASGWAVLRNRDLPAETHIAAVQKGSFEIRVETVGVLDAARAFHVASALRGDKGKIVQIAEDGAKVEKGDRLLRFDPTPFEADILRLSGDVKSREAVAEAARQSLEVEKSQAEKTLSHAEFDLKSAKQEYGRYLAYIVDLEELRKKGHAVVNEIAQARRKSEQMFTQLQKAESDLARIQKEVVFKVAQSMAELNKATSEVDTTRAALEQSRAELEKTVVHAPSAGFVVLHEIFQSNQKRKPRGGDTVWQGQPILYLPDLSSLVVKTQVREEDLHKTRAGLGAAIRVDAYPDASFEGEVASVGVLAMENERAAMVGKHFQYVVNLKGTDPRLRPGMTARVFIVADTVRDALTVPLAALFTENGRKVCYVYDGQRLLPVAVTVGRTNEDLAEVLDGLTVGQRVSLVRP